MRPVSADDILSPSYSPRENSTHHFTNMVFLMMPKCLGPEFSMSALTKRNDIPMVGVHPATNAAARLHCHCKATMPKAQKASSPMPEQTKNHPEPQPGKIVETAKKSPKSSRLRTVNDLSLLRIYPPTPLSVACRFSFSGTHQRKNPCLPGLPAPSHHREIYSLRIH